MIGALQDGTSRQRHPCKTESHPFTHAIVIESVDRLYVNHRCIAGDVTQSSYQIAKVAHLNVYDLVCTSILRLCVMSIIRMIIFIMVGEWMCTLHFLNVVLLKSLLGYFLVLKSNVLQCKKYE